jgi:hypothetical protein
MDGSALARAPASSASIDGRLGWPMATRNLKNFQHTGIALVDPWSPT